MEVLFWIVGSGVLMSLLALCGGAALFLSERSVHALLLPLVALAAGSLIGGAFFHMIPAALERIAVDTHVWLLVIGGFATFFALEQLLHWHHHGDGVAGDEKKPLIYLILLGNSLHHLIGGAAIAGTFLIDIRLGIATWTAAALHEIPQGLGDFAVLVHGGWSRHRALLFNWLSALTFLGGGVAVYAAHGIFDASYLVPFAAGNFLYLGATDLVPEVNKAGSLRRNLLHLAMFLAGVGILYLARALE